MNDQQQTINRDLSVSQAADEEVVATDLTAARASHDRIYAVARAALAKTVSRDRAEAELEKRKQQGGE